MNLILQRIAKKKEYTIGRLYMKEEREGTAPSLQYFCDTLEPTWRNVGWGKPGRKVAGRTAIPAGRYAVAVTWSPHLKEWLPLLLHVPLFEGIRIHAGNTAQDTRGCILVGENRKPGMVLNSRRTLSLLMKRLKERPEGEGIHIEVRD